MPGIVLGQCIKRPLKHLHQTYRKYREDGLQGGHIIMLGNGCESAALSALQMYPNGMQIGGK